MHKVFLDDVLLPYAPSLIKMQIKNKNETVDLINEGEVNQLKRPGLTQIEFKFELPYQRYPFVINFKPQKFFLEHLEKLKVSKRPFQFIVVRERGFGTNLKVSLEDYTVEEAASNALDITVSVKLKQYVDYGLKTITLPGTTTKNTTKTTKAVASPTSARTGAPKREGEGLYTVKKGDCLWAIAQRYYGNGALWKNIYNANKALIAPRNKGKRVAYYTIYVGQVLRIPPK